MGLQGDAVKRAALSSLPPVRVRTNAPMASERPVQEGDLQSQVQALMRRLNYKQVTIVKEVGINQSALSQWLHRKHRGALSKMESKLRTWVADKTRELEQGHFSGPSDAAHGR